MGNLSQYDTESDLGFNKDPKVIKYDPLADLTKMADGNVLSNSSSDQHDYAHDMSPGYKSAYEREASQAALHDQNAQKLLSSLNKNEVTPGQGILAALLAAVPTVGGYMAGRAAGTPHLSPNLKLSPSEINSVMSGPWSGMQQGAKLGMETGTDYLNALQAEADKKDKTSQALASIEMKEADSHRAAAGELQRGGLSQAGTLANEKVMEASRFDDQMKLKKFELANQKPSTFEQINNIFKGNPIAQGAADKFTSGQEDKYTPQEAQWAKENLGVLMTLSPMGRTRTGQKRANFAVSGGMDMLGYNQENGFVQDADPNHPARALPPADGRALSQEISGVGSGLRAMRDADAAYDHLGTVLSTSTISDPKTQAQVAADLHRLQFARKKILEAYTNNSIFGKGALKDSTIDQFSELLPEMPLSEKNLNVDAIKSAIASSALMRKTKLKEVENNIVSILHDHLAPSGLAPNVENIIGMSNYDPGLGFGGANPLPSNPPSSGGSTSIAGSNSGAIAEPDKSSYDLSSDEGKRAYLKDLKAYNGQGG